MDLGCGLPTRSTRSRAASAACHAVQAHRVPAEGVIPDLAGIGGAVEAFDLFCARGTAARPVDKQQINVVAL
jgi:hypothetical protein